MRLFILAVLLFAALFSSGCIQTGIQPAIAMAPYMDFEATVVSVTPDSRTPDYFATSEPYVEGEALSGIPIDAATVRIDRIVRTGGSSNYDWAGIGMEEGKEVTMVFYYTARPAKILTIPGKEVSYPSGVVSYQAVKGNVTFEDGYFVFTKGSNRVSETVLPGLHDGSRFAARINGGAQRLFLQEFIGRSGYPPGGVDTENAVLLYEYDVNLNLPTEPPSDACLEGEICPA